MSELFSLFTKHITDQRFPCIAARSAVNSQNVSFLEAGHIACPHDDEPILDFLYKFVSRYRAAPHELCSAVVLFNQPQTLTEDLFDMLLWKRLQALHDLDRLQHKYDDRVSHDPQSAAFSFSIGKEAFFIIGMHPASSRPARAFSHPAIVFNPHAQFEQLRADQRYDKIKAVVRKRELRTVGSINPMLSDFGERSETFQYSGRQHTANWQCPLNIKHD